MSMLNNSLTLWVIWNTCEVLDPKGSAKILKSFARIARSIISLDDFWNARSGKCLETVTDNMFCCLTGTCCGK